MKKFLSFFLAIVMMLSLVGTSFAADDPGTTALNSRFLLDRNTYGADVYYSVRTKTSQGSPTAEMLKKMEPGVELSVPSADAVMIMFYIMPWRYALGDTPTAYRSIGTDTYSESFSSMQVTPLSTFGSLSAPGVAEAKEMGCTHVFSVNSFDASRAFQKIKLEWEATKFTIRFDSNGGTSVEPIVQYYGQPIEKPEDPYYEGHELVGWRKDGVLFEFETMPDESFTLVADWGRKQYTVTFDPNHYEAVYEGEKTVKGYFGDTIAKPTVNPSLRNFYFAGWYYEGNPWDFATDTLPAKDITLKAKWDEKPNEQVTFLPNGGSGIMNPEPIHAYEPYVIPTPTFTAPEGYRFVGWLSSITEKIVQPGDEINAVESFTLTAQWERIDYKIEYDLDGGENSPLNPSTYTVDTDTFALHDPKKPGHEFLGWRLGDSSAVRKEVIIPQGSTGDRKYTAKWDSIEYMLIVYPNNGEERIRRDYKYGDALDLPLLERPGYTFGGWYTNTTFTEAFEGSTMPDRNLVLYAKWDAIEYKITYNLNGGSVPGNPTSYTVNSGPLIIANPTKDHCIFRGWTVDGGTRLYNPYIIYRGRTGDVALEAQWLDLDDILTVTFISNEIDGGVILDEVTVMKGDTIRMPTVPIKVGYDGLGWFDENDKQYNSYTPITESIKLYATYQVTEYRINYTLNGGGNPMDAKFKYTIEDETFVIAPAVRNGYVMKEWIVNGVHTYAQTYTVEQGSTGHLRMEAVWVKAEDAVYVTIRDNFFGDDNIIHTIVLERGEKCILPAQVKRDGYDSLGFFTEAGTRFVSGTRVNINTTLYAKYGTTNYTPCPTESYTDIDHSSWYHLAADYVVDKGLMSGTSTNVFSPNGTMTRGMVVTVLYRIAGQPAAYYYGDYVDVARGTWYTDAVAWATRTGVVEGYGNGRFGPADPITREQMITILHRYVKYVGLDYGIRDSYRSYADASKVSSWAADSMKWALAEGMVTGVGNNRLAPEQTCKRSEGATLLMRFCQAYLDKYTYRSDIG